MTTTTLAPAPFGRTRWILPDAWTITKRDLAHWVAAPGPVILGWVFPVMVTLMFSALFGGAIETPGGGSYLEFLMPGMLAMTMAFGLETTMTAVTMDASKGITDRFRSLPMNSGAVVLGRCLADMLNSIVGLAVMVATGLALGWRWHEGPASALAAFALLLMLRLALLWVGIYLGLTVKGPESLAAVQILVWPVLFLSNAFVDTSTMPSWLGTIAEWNPLSATAAAVRELFGNPGWGTDSWMTQHSIVLALVWPVLITAVFLPLSVRRFRALGN
ncbi:ABC transporter permease [Rhodococcus sp. NPDC058481]|uniref:ABC transporter permease n=1 Tax=unclassified Rhodococcus (in: high G+C Gram-positive bacteria) TaxID=192944 RepID=UPI00364CE512